MASHTTTHVTALTSTTFDELVGSADLPVVVDLWAEWCGPCVPLGRAIEELAQEREGQMVFATLDVDAHPDIALRYQALSVPTVLVFRDGELRGRLVGSRPTARLAAEIDTALATA